VDLRVATTKALEFLKDHLPGISPVKKKGRKGDPEAVTATVDWELYEDQGTRQQGAGDARRHGRGRDADHGKGKGRR
jgi:hypothetical protein